MRVLASLLLFLLAACGGGPDADGLRKDIAARLGEALPGGTLTLASLERRGSQSDTKAPSGETRRILYFDAQLKVEKDFDFGSWDGPGVAGLVSAMGAGPKGLSGIVAGGNKAGDMVVAHGTAVYKKEGDKWAPVVSAGYRHTAAPAYATNAPQGAAAVLDAMRKVVDSVPPGAAPAQRAVVEEELTAAYATIRARLARAQAGYAIAAGPERGQYLRFAQALADTTGLRAVALVTLGGEENVRLLRDGKVSLALAQGDVALHAYEGKGNFTEEGPYPTLRAIGSLYPEPVHVIVRADSPVQSMGDLAGKRVAIGLRGSASRTTAVQVLQAHGLSLNQVQPAELSIGDALVGLRRGTVDVVIQVIGVPADRVRDALDEIPLRLVSLAPGAIARLAGANAGYFAHSIPAGAYSGQKREVKTIATAALLLVAPDLSEAEIGAVTRFVYAKGRDFTARGSAQGAQVSAANARTGVPIPISTAAGKALDGMGGKPP